MQHSILLSVVLIVVAVAAGAVVWWYDQEQRRKHLRKRFGPEYERTVAEMDDRRRAEAELSNREKRVKKLSIRSLTPAERQRFASSWQRIQARFVDNPGDAASEAEQLLQELMLLRGYPKAGDEELAKYVSVDHPRFVQNYRDAQQIARAHEHGEANTEQLRQAIVYYRALFDDLLEAKKAA